MEIFAGHSSGDGAPAKLGSVSHLQNVVVESGDALATVHYQSFQTDAHSPRRKTIARALSSRHRASRFEAATQREILDLAQFLSPPRRHFEISPAASHRITAAAGVGSGRALDGRTHRGGQRRSRRRLSGDAELHDCAARARLFEKTSRL